MKLKKGSGDDWEASGVRVSTELREVQAPAEKILETNESSSEVFDSQVLSRKSIIPEEIYRRTHCSRDVWGVHNTI